MPRPGNRTRSRKQNHKRLPGSRGRTHYKLEAGAHLLCRNCGKPLAGIPRAAPSKVRKLNLTKRRISRPSGGQLCHDCLKLALKQATRSIQAT